MARKNIYRGASFFEYERTKNFSLKDVELVKLDLLNRIYTRKGERIMMPNEGTILPDIIFEPLDSETIQVVEEDLRAVFRRDPRVEVLSFEMIPLYDDQVLSITVRLLYKEFDIIDDFNLQLEFESV